MLKEVISYIDYNGEETTEVAYFNMTIVELTRFEAKLGESITDYTEKLAKEKNLNKMIAFMEELILSSYGRKSEDGSRFLKREEWTKDFEESAAYAEMFTRLLTEPSYTRRIGEGLVSNAKKDGTVVDIP